MSNLRHLCQSILQTHTGSAPFLDTRSLNFIVPTNFPCYRHGLSNDTLYTCPCLHTHDAGVGGNVA